MNKKILYLFDVSDWQSRMAVAYGAREKGIEVVIGLINGTDEDAAKAEGFKVILLSRSTHKFSILSAVMMIRDIYHAVKEEQPDILHAVTLKYAFLSGLAVWPFKSVEKIFTLAGLGYLFRSGTTSSLIMRTALRPLLTLIFRRKKTRLIFQNPDDLDLIFKGHYAKKEHCILIRGSGIYLDRFTPCETRDETTKPTILMPTRLVHEKGISVFIEAARLLKNRDVDATFEIAGGETKHNPKAISRAEMEEMIHDGCVTWLGHVDDLPQRLACADIIVYPSYYGEGIPRVLLEACAAGSAIITTDHPGCREAVSHDRNGILVPVKDMHATADAISDLLENPEKRREMGAQSRLKAEEEFDIHLIVAQTTALYEQ